MATTLQRLARVVDRARVLIQLSPDEMKKQGLSDQTLHDFIVRHIERVAIGEQAMRFYFLAVVLFVGGCLAIGVDLYARSAWGLLPNGHDRLGWLPVSVIILGMASLLAGAFCMSRESTLGRAQLHEEFSWRLKVGKD